MNSLWLSLSGGAGHLVVQETARRYFEGWLTPHQVGDAVTVIMRLVRHVESADHKGELILSRHDSILLIEVVTYDASPASRRVVEPPFDVQCAPARNWGAHPTSTGSVVWAEIRLDDT